MEHWEVEPFNSSAASYNVAVAPCGAMDWQLRDQLQCLDSELSALLRPSVSSRGSNGEHVGHVKREAPKRRCPGCVRPLRPLRIQVLGQCTALLGVRGFAWSAGLNRLQRRDLAEVLWTSCADVEDPLVQELCFSLQNLPWTRNKARLDLPSFAPPDPRAVTLLCAHAAGSAKGETAEEEDCSFCMSLVKQETKLEQALLSLGAKLFSWSAGVGSKFCAAVSSMLHVNISFPSGSGETLLLPEHSKVADLKLLAQKTFKRGFLKLVTVEGHVLTNLTDSLQAAGVQDGDRLTAVAQRANLSATDEAFALWCCGGNKVVTWGDRFCGGDCSAVQDQLRNVAQIQATSVKFQKLGVLRESSVRKRVLIQRAWF
eukprot:s1007_g23.t1